MLLFNMLKNIDVLNTKDLQNIDITGLAINSNKVQNGNLFVCIKGTKVNGHKYMQNAKQKGASAFLVQKINKKVGGLQILVKDTRKALSHIAKNFFNVQNMPKIVGITGTNGKTTTSYLVASILQSAGKRVGVIGTQGAVFEGVTKNLNMTTPDPIELFKTINEMSQNGAEFVVMEVSAHAIALKKVDALKFDVKAITNITQDHLDFFKSLKKYQNCKLGFMVAGDAHKVVNIDDFVCSGLKNVAKNVISYSVNKPANIFAFNINKECNKYSVNCLHSTLDISSQLFGKYNISNTLCAIGICKALGIEDEYIISGIKNFAGVEGRFNVVQQNGIRFIVDFAHTPDAFENVIKVAREITTGKLIAVFGCGGDRDKNKRPKMGNIASKLCDFVVITEDNPRSEKIECICNDIKKGIKKGNFVIIHNRKDALWYAYNMARQGDCILALGKGAENYIEKNGIKTPYLDMQAIKSILAENK